MRIEDALGKFVTQLRADGRTEHTVRQYQRHVRALVRWLGSERLPDDVASIDHEVLARFLTSPAARDRPDGVPKKATSTNALRTSLRCLFAYLAAARYVPHNPAQLVRRALCGAPLPKALSADDQKRLLDTLAAGSGKQAERDHVLFRLMLATGIRLGSALGLEVGDVDLNAGELRLRHAKGDREQRVALHEPVTDLVRTFLGDRTTGPLFAGPAGQRLSHRHVQRRLAGWAVQAGVRQRLAPHALRHSFAVAAYQRSHDVLALRNAMGHRSLASTLIYVG